MDLTFYKGEREKIINARTNPLNGFSRWSSEKICHKVQLMHNIFPRKQWFSSEHFRKYTSYAPNINGRCVLHRWNTRKWSYIWLACISCTMHYHIDTRNFFFGGGVTAAERSVTVEIAQSC